MTRVVFHGPNVPECHAEARPGTVLLDLARLEGQPIYWHCGRGTCGTCLVRVRPSGRETPREISVPRKERNVLAYFGYWAEDAAKRQRHPDIPALPRLACQYEIGDEDLEVRW